MFYVVCLDQNCFWTLGEGYDRDAMPDHSFRSEEDAVTAWNTRATQAATALGDDALSTDKEPARCRYCKRPIYRAGVGHVHVETDLITCRDGHNGIYRAEPDLYDAVAQLRADRSIAIEVLQALNFDTALADVEPDIQRLTAIISTHTNLLRFQLFAAQEANRLADKTLADTCATPTAVAERARRAADRFRTTKLLTLGERDRLADIITAEFTGAVGHNDA
jgi:hypothetical protein